MCCALTKVILWPLWLRSFVKQNMGLMWPSAGKGNATRWGVLLSLVVPCLVIGEKRESGFNYYRWTRLIL